MTPFLAQTPTRVPTIENNEAYDLLRKIIQDNSDCQLPCWGGITPGITSTLDAGEIVRPLFSVLDGGFIADYKGHRYLSAGGGRTFLVANTEVSFILGWWYYEGDNIVQKLHIKAFAYQELNGKRVITYGSEAYNQLFEEFSLHGILSVYGVPATVMTFAQLYTHNDTPFQNPEEFQLILLYPDKGIFIEYTMPLIRKGNNTGIACPSDAIFETWLIPSNSGDFYIELWSSYTTGSPDFTSRQPIDESIQMNSDEFYRTYLKADAQCFEVDMSIWPEH